MRFKILGVVAVALIIFTALAIYKTGRGSDTGLTTQNRISESYVRSSVVVVKQTLQTFQSMTPEKLGALKTRKELWPDGWMAFKETSQDEALYLKDNQSLQGPNVQSFLAFVANKAPNLSKEVEIYSWRDENQRNYFVIFLQRSKQFLAVLIQNPFKTLSTIANATPEAELSVINENREIIFSDKTDYLGQKIGANVVVDEIKAQGLEQNAALFKSAGKSIWGRYQRIPGTNLFVVRTNPVEDTGFGRQSLLNLAIFGGLSLMVLAALTLILRANERSSPTTTQTKSSVASRDVPEATKNKSEPALNPKAIAIPTATASKAGTNLPSLPATSGISNEAASEEKLEAYKRMVASLGHEIRRPLFSVMGKIQIAHQQTQDDQVGRELSKAVNEIRGLRVNLDKLLNFSGEEQWEKSDTAIDVPLNKALDDLDKIITNKRVIVTKRMEASDVFPLEVEGLRKAFENIIENAIESMERMADKKLNIHSFHDGHKVVITFTDNGEGMSPEVRAQAFEPFYTTRSYAHHMGLGLWQAYSIVKSHGGDLEIQSEKGRGTKVLASFPVGVSIPKGLPALPIEPVKEDQSVEIRRDTEVEERTVVHATEPDEEISMEKLKSLPLLPETERALEESKQTRLAPLMPPLPLPAQRYEIAEDEIEATTISPSTLSNAPPSFMPKAPIEKDIDDLLSISDPLMPDAPLMGGTPTVSAAPAKAASAVNDDRTPVSMVSPPRFRAPERKKEIDSYQVKIRQPGERTT